MNSQRVAGIILAAGKGTRMKSDLPKGLQPVCGLPMVEIVGRALKRSGVDRPVVVIGHGGETVKERLGDGYDYVWQHEQLGTGHAAMMAAPLLQDHEGPVIVALGDTPLVNESVFLRLLEAHRAADAQCTFTSAIMANPFGYGRVVKDTAGFPAQIIEEKDCTDEQKAIQEVHAGMYVFDAQWLRQTLPQLSTENAQGEYYLTDTIAHISNAGGRVRSVIFEEHGILVGVNDRWQLSLAEIELRRRIVKSHALNGVTFRDIETAYIGPDVEIGVDTVIGANTHLEGRTVIGRGSSIGPNSRIVDSIVGDRTTVTMSQVEQSRVGNEVWIGPFANIRPKTDLGDGVKIGDFVETKNAVFAAGAKANHLSYIGDATVGADTNIGAGTITCNYDGFVKSKTTIGANAFVGSHSTLVAPVTIGDGAMVAAGSVITRDVAAESLALGRARQEIKEQWVSQWRAKKGSKNNA